MPIVFLPKTLLLTNLAGFLACVLLLAFPSFVKVTELLTTSAVNTAKLTVAETALVLHEIPFFYPTKAGPNRRQMYWLYD